MRRNFRRLSWITFCLAILGSNLFFLANAATVTIHPYAGSATFWRPHGITTTGSGISFKAYIADSTNHRIVKVDANGSTTIVAGNGTGGFSGDSGPAISAQLREPYDVAVDLNGNLYIADAGNQRIRKVDTTGVITTIAGNGSRGFSGDGGSASSSRLNGPYSVATHNSDLYIADTLNHRIRKIDGTGKISTVVGDGFSVNGIGRYLGDHGPATSASLNMPYDVAFASDGSMFIADTFNNRIRKVESSGFITTVAGVGAPFPNNGVGSGGIPSYAVDAGPAIAAMLNNPSGVAVAPDGSFFIADSRNSRVRKVDTAGSISTVAGSVVAGNAGDGGPATDAKLSFPYAVAMRDGDLIVVDPNNNNVRIVMLSYAQVPVTVNVSTRTALLLGNSLNNFDPTVIRVRAGDRIYFYVPYSGSSYSGPITHSFTGGTANGPDHFCTNDSNAALGCESGNIASGSGVTLTILDAKGSHAFRCRLHPNMNGIVVIE